MHWPTVYEISSQPSFTRKRESRFFVEALKTKRDIRVRGCDEQPRHFSHMFTRIHAAQAA